jgi:arylsulfatase A-like enzyme
MRIRLLSVLLVTLMTFASRAQAQTHPNIIFIMTDDQRWDALSCMGHPFFKCPNTDRIATEGAKFMNYFVTIPLCSPSRAVILTGQYSHKNGITDNTNRAEQSFKLVTFPQQLQKVGYQTAFMGKWHMGNDSNPRPGWDHWVGMPGQGKYIDCPLNIDGNLTDVKGYITDVIDQYACDYIKQKHDKPFFLYIGEKAWHDPHRPADRHAKLYEGEKIPRPPSVDDDLSGKPALHNDAMQKHLGHETGGYPDETILQQLRTIQAVDESVGHIFKTLEETGQLDNTVIIYTSDNGYFWGEHHLGDKRAAYEESIRDPLLIRYPKLIKAGTVIDQLTLNLDVGPTILDLAGAEIPADYQGKSWLPLFTGDTKSWRSEFLAEYFLEKAYAHIPTWQAVRTDRWKLIHYPDLKDSDELYDLQNDRYEMKNLIDDPGAKEQREKLRGDLEKLMKQTT